VVAWQDDEALVVRADSRSRNGEAFRLDVVDVSMGERRCWSRQARRATNENRRPEFAAGLFSAPTHTPHPSSRGGATALTWSHAQIAIDFHASG